MARKKVKLQRIANDAKRRTTFRKRLKGLTKKASELATLCGVDTCLVVYGEGEAQATEVWPSVPEATGVLERFKAMPQLDRYKKMTDLEGFLKERIGKLLEQRKKARCDADESETKLLLVEALDGRRVGLEGLTIEQLTSLGWMADARLKIVNERLEKLRGQGLLPSTTAGYTAMEETQTQREEGWLMDVGRGMGSIGMVANLSGEGDMAMVHPFNNGTGFSWPNQGPSFPSM